MAGHTSINALFRLLNLNREDWMYEFGKVHKGLTLIAL